MILSKEVKIKWNYKTKDYYESKGYVFTKFNDDFIVHIDDLIKTTHVVVECECDRCGKINKNVYAAYNKFCARHDGKYFCQVCASDVYRENSISERQERHMIKMLKQCEINGYTLLSKKEEIETQRSYIRYLCPKHGEQKMRVHNFESGRRCPECRIDNSRIRYRLPQEIILKRVEECHGKLLNVDDYINQDTKNLKFECPVCGNIFVSSLQKFTQHGGRVCPDCSGIKSLGERRIEEYLQDNNIEYIPQYWFNDCRDINPLPFDFYIPNKNTIIEFDGRQHFEDTNWFTYSLETTQKHDSIKNEYCELNNINLIRINYKQINHINEILDDLLVV